MRSLLVNLTLRYVSGVLREAKGAWTQPFHRLAMFKANTSYMYRRKCLLPRCPMRGAFCGNPAPSSPHSCSLLQYISHLLLAKSLGLMYMHLHCCHHECLSIGAFVPLGNVAIVIDDVSCHLSSSMLSRPYDEHSIR